MTSRDPILDQSVDSRETAERTARQIGCEGAHRKPDGTWGPCPSEDDLMVLINRGAAGYRRWRSKQLLRQKTVAEENKSGVAVVALPDMSAREQIVRPDGGMPVDELHVTLAYLGRTSTVNVTEADLIEYMRPVAARFGAFDALYSHVSHLGEKKNALVYELKSKGLHDIHDATVDMFNTYDVNWSDRYLYRPHTTIGWYDGKVPVKEGPLKPKVPVRIAALAVWFGERRTVLPLGMNVKRTRFIKNADGEIEEAKCDDCYDPRQVVPQFSVDLSHKGTKRTFRTRKAAENYAAQIGCEGAHKVGGAWAPCLSEEDLRWANPRPERAGQKRRTNLSTEGTPFGGTP